MPSKPLILCRPLLLLVAPSFPYLTQIIQHYFIWGMLIKHLQWTWSWTELSHEYVLRWNCIALRKLIICIPSSVCITCNITLAVWKWPSGNICNIINQRADSLEKALMLGKGPNIFSSNKYLLWFLCIFKFYNHYYMSLDEAAIHNNNNVYTLCNTTY